MAVTLSKSNSKVIIIVVSILIPVAVGLLVSLQGIINIESNIILRLPLFHAILNSLTALSLLFSLYFIKVKKVEYHRTANLIALALSSIFLISYVIYHSAAESTFFGDADKNGVLTNIEKMEVGSIRYVYLFTLLTHIVLAIVVVPLVLFAFYFAYLKEFAKHKKVVRFAYPIWLYVAITGVLVYIFLIPYYKVQMF